MTRPSNTPALALAAAAALAAACAAAPPPPPPKPAAVAAAPAAPPAPTTAPPPAAAGIIAAALDPAVKPCDDFYAYACGGWIAKNEIPADKATWGTFEVLAQENTGRLRAILDAAAVPGAATDPVTRKFGDYYAACMDEAAIEKTGVADLKAEWKKLDGVKDGRSLAAATGRLHAAGVPVLFAFGSTQDAKDTSRVIAGILQGGLGLPDRDYYLKDDPKSREIQEAYQAFLAKMFVLAGARPAAAAKDAKAIFALEKAMAATHWTRVELRDPAKLYNPHDLAALQARTPHFPWKAYLPAAGAPAVAAFDVQAPKALAGLDALVKKTPAATWRAYLRSHVLLDLARGRALPKAFVDEAFAFRSQHFSGAKAQLARWEFCVHATDGALGEALGQAFVAKWFPGDARDKALQLVVNVQKAQGANLDALPWMDPPTRAQAHQKLAKIDNKIGYPARWRDYAALEVSRDHYVRSRLAAAAFEVRRDLAKIGQPVDRNEWGMSPPTVNAYYNPPMNEMVFPAGILQPPFYTRGANDAVNYGGAGFVVGHELTHGFDDEGRQYDADGNLKDWWTAPVGAEFDRRAACVEKQYDAYVAVDDVKVNGKLTLGENIADLGGLKLALAAYRASRAGQLPEAPVAGLSPDQQFFVAAAQVWCGAYRPQVARMLAQTNPHAPPRWRVNGPMANLPEFAAAFSCKAGDAMVRADRCEVW